MLNRRKSGICQEAAESDQSIADCRIERRVRLRPEDRLERSFDLGCR
jgi:hypothetical protein